ncbi:MAG: transcriptional regulator, partial [Microbacterium sp.]
VLFDPKPLTSEEVDEFILIARSWVRQPVEADAVMELSLDDMRAMFGQWGQGASAEDADHTRWPVGGADFRETMYGLSWIPTGVEYTTDLPDPARAELRETLQRMLRAVDAPAPARPVPDPR